MGKENSIKVSVKKYNLIIRFLWIGIFVFWIVTDIVQTNFPEIYKTFDTVFRFGTTAFLAGLLLLKNMYIDDINNVKEILAKDTELYKAIRKKHYMQNAVLIVIILVAFFARGLALVTGNLIYEIVGLIVFTIVQLILYKFGDNVINSIEIAE